MGNAEEIENQCNRLKFQLGSNETASTCSTNQQNISLLRTQQFVLPASKNLPNSTKYSSQKPIVYKDEKMKMSSSKYSDKDVGLETTRQMTSGISLNATQQSECRQRKRNADNLEDKRRLVGLINKKIS